MIRAIKQGFSHYRNLKTVNFEKVPIIRPMRKRFIINKDGSFTMLIKVEGVDYHGLSEQKQLQLFKARETVLKKADGFILSSYTTRFRQRVKIDFKEIEPEISNQVLKHWGNSFVNCYVNHHYIALTTIQNVVKKTVVRDSAKIEALEKMGDFVISNLKEFNARVLEECELVGFFCSLLNGRQYTRVDPVNDAFETYLSTTPVSFPEFSNNFYYLDHDKVASFVTIKNLPEIIHQAVFDALIQRNIEMIISQHATVMRKEDAIAFVKDRLKSEQRPGKRHNEIIKDELEGILELLNANKTSLSDHCLAIQVISENETKHRANLTEIETLLENNNFSVTRNVMSKEALYWSQFPTKMGSNVRKRRVNSQNITQSITFASSGKGNKRCSWGERPLCSFTTQDGNIFDFIFHKDEEKFVKGHTLIIGDTGVGKTTFISFLLTCARVFEDMQIIAFDKLHGMEIATKMQGGTYVDFSSSSNGINPFLLEDNQANKGFITEFLSTMIDADDQERILIENNADEILKWDKESICLDELPHLFTRKGTKLFEKMRPWMSGGMYGAYFSSKQNAFTLDNTLTTFDFTDILELPKVLGLVASYLTHLFFSKRTKNPKIVFIDEFRNYLESSIFRNLLSKLNEEFRKLNGVFVCALQNISQIWSNEIGRRSLGNFAKYILYPVPAGINVEGYKDGLHLTDDEIAWLVNADPSQRQVMVKTAGGTSTIVNIDMKYLEEYLHIFNSASDDVILINQLIEQYPDRFREIYLQKKRHYVS